MSPPPPSSPPPPPPAAPPIDLHGRVCVVTGFTSGIGLETARALARRGAHVVGAARDPARAEATARALEPDARAGGGAVEPMVCDLASLASVRAFADAFRRHHDRLHVLVHNAGAAFTSRQLSPDGHELTFATNHLGPFLLTHLLRDLLVASAPARVVVVSSAAHQGRRLDLDTVATAPRYSGWRAYGESKLANVLFTYELARRLDGTGVTANCLHPGVVGSSFATNNGRLARAAMWLARPFLLSTTEGAATSIHLAASPEVAHTSGRYFVRSKEARSSRVSHDADLAARLWALSERLVGA